MNGNELFNMKLHESKSDGIWNITRVNGGWLYMIKIGDSSPVFVPLSNEFVEEIKHEDIL